jgi:hypothetical protein
MIRLFKLTTVLAVLAAVLGSLPAEANLVAYSEWSANRIQVMVMDDTGANAVEVHQYSKFSLGGNFTISPAGADGTSWVAIEDYGLLKVRVDGEEPTKVLCFQGTDINGSPYQLYGEPQWSPDGSEILVQTMSSLALIAANFEVGPDCDSDLVPIYAYDWENGVGWILEGMAAWNGDGSRIAFFEFLQPQGLEARLVILERGPAGWVVERTVDASHVEFFDGIPLYLDWQRGGNVLAFQTRGFTGPHQSTTWLNSIDAVSGEWALIAEGESPSWSPDDSELLFTDSSGKLVKWAYPDGPGETLGPGEQPDWQRNPLAVACQTDLDCDDSNSCTEDLCNTVTGACSNDPVSDNTSCGTNGWCIAGACFEPECDVAGLACDDANACTVDVCSSYECLFDAAAAAGFFCDDGDGCTVGDACDGAGGCAGVFDPTMPGCSCLPKGEVCTTNDDCCSGSCHSVKGTCK